MKPRLTTSQKRNYIRYSKMGLQLLSVNDIKADSTNRALKDIVETGKIAAAIRNEVK